LYHTKIAIVFSIPTVIKVVTSGRPMRRVPSARPNKTNDITTGRCTRSTIWSSKSFDDWRANRPIIPEIIQSATFPIRIKLTTMIAACR